MSCVPGQRSQISGCARPSVVFSRLPEQGLKNTYWKCHET